MPLRVRENLHGRQSSHREDGRMSRFGHCRIAISHSNFHWDACDRVSGEAAGGGIRWMRVARRDECKAKEVLRSKCAKIWDDYSTAAPAFGTNCIMVGISLLL